jgi:hypothetical protein
MTKLVARALRPAPVLVAALAALLVAGGASAHPGHGTPHLLHEGDAIVGWWIVGALAAAAVAARLLGRGRS